MPSLRPLLGALAAVVALILVPEHADAQASSTTELNTFTVSLMGGLGGSIDSSESGYDNSTIQLGLSSVPSQAVKLGLRIGRLGSMERLGNVLDADLTYLTVSGEYLFGEAGYQSGVFLGLGVYELEGTRRLFDDAFSTTTAGLTGGVTGEFDISRRFGILAELSFHGLVRGDDQFFATGLVGLAYYIK